MQYICKVCCQYEQPGFHWFTVVRWKFIYDMSCYDMWYLQQTNKQSPLEVRRLCQTYKCLEGCRFSPCAFSDSTFQDCGFFRALIFKWSTSNHALLLMTQRRHNIYKMKSVERSTTWALCGCGWRGRRPLTAEETSDAFKISWVGN